MVREISHQSYPGLLTAKGNQILRLLSTPFTGLALLSTRTHECSKCGTSLHRDHNAARNILVKGLLVLGVEKSAKFPEAGFPDVGNFVRSTGGQPGTHAWGETHLWSIEGNYELR